MCLITESNALTMKVFQSIFLGQEKNQSKSYAFFNICLEQ